MGNCVQKIRKAKFIEQQGQCYYCIQPMWEENGEHFALSHGISASAANSLRSTAEHLVARQDGGTDTHQNIVAACRYCNCTRHKTRNPTTPIDYAQKVRTRLWNGKWHGMKLTQVPGN